MLQVHPLLVFNLEDLYLVIWRTIASIRELLTTAIRIWRKPNKKIIQPRWCRSCNITCFWCECCFWNLWQTLIIRHHNLYTPKHIFIKFDNLTIWQIDMIFLCYRLRDAANYLVQKRVGITFVDRAQEVRFIAAKAAKCIIVKYAVNIYVVSDCPFKSRSILVHIVKGSSKLATKIK